MIKKCGSNAPKPKIVDALGNSLRVGDIVTIVNDHLNDYIPCLYKLVRQYGDFEDLYLEALDRQYVAQEGYCSYHLLMKIPKNLRKDDPKHLEGLVKLAGLWKEEGEWDE